MSRKASPGYQMTIEDFSFTYNNKLTDSAFDISNNSDYSEDCITGDVTINTPSGVSFVIRKAMPTITQSARHLLAQALYLCSLSESKEVQFDLRNYLNMQGKSVSYSALQKAKLQFKKDASLLCSLEPLPWTEYRNDKGRKVLRISAIFDSMDIEQYGYGCTIRFTDGFMEYIKEFPYRGFSNIRYLGLQGSLTQDYLYHYMESYFTKNFTTEHRKDKDGFISLKVETLLRHSGLPSFDRIKNKSRHYDTLIIIPFDNALIELKEKGMIEYYYTTADGERLDGVEYLDYQAFANYKVFFKVLEMPARPVKKEGRKRKTTKEKSDQGGSPDTDKNL